MLRSDGRKRALDKRAPFKSSGGYSAAVHEHETGNGLAQHAALGLTGLFIPARIQRPSRAGGVKRRPDRSANGGDAPEVETFANSEAHARTLSGAIS